MPLFLTNAAFLPGLILNEHQNQISDLASSKASSLGLNSTSLIINGASIQYESCKSPDLINHLAMSLENNFDNMYAESYDEQANISFKSHSSKLRLRNICSKFSNFLVRFYSYLKSILFNFYVRVHVLYILFIIGATTQSDDGTD